MAAAAAGALSDNLWKNWDKSGKSEFFKVVRNLTPSDEEEEAALIEVANLEQIKRLVYELVWKCLKGTLKRDQTAQAIGELTTVHREMGSLLVDLFTLIDTETSMIDNDKERSESRDRFVGVLKESERYLCPNTLKERMEIATLGEAGIVKNAKKFFSTVIKTKTKMYYKQQKFNLFREECEGYAKLVTELNQDLTLTTPSEVLKTIMSIIGYFNLDPNRVLDIILEAFECQLDQHEFFVRLLNLYTPDPTTMNEILGFKYKFYTSDEERGDVPETLFRQTALMIQHGVLELEAIYAQLSPTDDEITGDADKETNDAKEFVRKMNIVSTNQDVKKDQEEGAQATNGISDQAYAKNQKFGLLQALLDVGAWSHAELLISRLPTYYAVSQRSIASSLANLIHRTMAPVHSQYCGLHERIRTKQYRPLENDGAPPQAKTYKDFKDTVIPMLLTLGPYAHDDGVLLYKVLRILKSALGIPSDESGKEREKIAEPVDPSTTCLYYDILTIMDEVMLPAISLSDTPNCCLAEEIWTILRVYPYHMRYRLYGQWKSNTYVMHPPLLRKKALMQKSIKRIMQRISKENVKPTSRALGKLTHSSPGLLFEYILSQIQLYDNLIGPVVDSLKYLTSLSFDVLGYSIIEALNNPEKDRTKHDGTSISLWLQSLSNFCGAVFKKYNIELTGILQYVANQLKSKRSLDLLILKEVVLKMSGIEAAEEMTNEQIDAMAGGELLRQEAGSFNQIKNTKKSSQRLKDALIDNNLAVPLCLLMAQQRNCVVYQETENSHLKLVGKLFDQCQDTLVQFGQFLATNLSIDDYTRRLPPMKELLTRYHVNSDLAFFLARPMFNHQISLKFDDLRRQDSTKAWKSKNEEERQAVYVQAAREIMEPVTMAIRPLHPAKVWDDISPQFLTTFWSLTMYDLFVPEQVYEKEIGKLKAAPAKVDENKDLNTAKRKKEKERIHSLMEKMQDEQKRQKEHVERVMARLRAEKDSWFFSRSAKLAKNETITTFLQLCLFPRCIFTCNDAIYCAKFVQVIHMLKTPNFSTLICFDRIFCDITYTVTSCTENEAHRYGRFLAAMLETVMRWHKAREVFERECVGYPGFVTKFRVASAETKEAKSADDHVDYENYRHVCHKWHYKIAKALVVCLESKDYVQIRNALTILTKVLPHFPVIQALAGVIEKRIDKVCTDEKDERKDLYIKAMSYSGQLKARKSLMMREQEFHLTKAKPGSAAANNSAEAMDTTPPKKANAASKERSSISKERDIISSREKSLSRPEREKSEDHKGRKERSASKSKETKDKKDDRSKDHGDMGPPQTLNHHHQSNSSSSKADGADGGKRATSKDKERSSKSKDREVSSSRSRSREKALSSTDKTASSGESERKGRKERASEKANKESKTTGKLKRGEERKDRHPASSSHHRRSGGSSEERDTKRRKVDDEDNDSV